jgi:hypothetical protein
MAQPGTWRAKAEKSDAAGARSAKSAAPPLPPLPPPPPPLPPPPPPPASAPVPLVETCRRRFDFCLPELQQPRVWLNGLVNVLVTSMYLPMTTQFGGLFFEETYSLDDFSANMLLVWIKLALLLALVPIGLILDGRLVGYHTALIAGISALLLSWLLLGLASSLIPPALPAVLSGLGMATAYTAGQPLLYLRLHAANSGRMLGFFFMLYQLATIICALTIGFLHDSTHLPGATSRSASGVDFLAAGEALALLLAIALAVLDRCQEPTSLAAAEEAAGNDLADEDKAA